MRNHPIRPRPLAAFCLGLALCAGLAGCSSHYRVSDPAGTKLYYTKSIDRSKSGSIRFKDAGTGSEVTMQSSEVTKISKKEFESAVKPKP